MMDKLWSNLYCEMGEMEISTVIFSAVFIVDSSEEAHALLTSLRSILQGWQLRKTFFK